MAKPVFINKEIGKTAANLGWKLTAHAENNRQTGTLIANRGDIELRVSNRTFVECYIEPAQIDRQMQELLEKPDAEWTEADRAFFIRYRNY